VEVSLHVILNGDEWSNSDAFLPGKEPLVHTEYEAGWVPEPM